jgi:hypothetical protein
VGRLKLASWAGTTTPEAVTAPALEKDLVASAGVVAIGVGVGVAAGRQAVPAIANAASVVTQRHILKCLAIWNLLL